MELKATINRMLDPNNGSARAISSLSIGGAFAVHGVKVIDGPNGAFVSMPATKQPDGKYKDTFHAITAEARQEMNSTILAAYQQKLADMNQDEGVKMNM